MEGDRKEGIKRHGNMKNSTKFGKWNDGKKKAKKKLMNKSIDKLDNGWIKM